MMVISFPARRFNAFGKKFRGSSSVRGARTRLVRLLQAIVENPTFLFFDFNMRSTLL